MKLPRPFLLAGLVLACAWPAVLSAADAAKTVAGYWAGSVTTPRGELPLSVEFIAAGDGKWQGTLDFPRQGVRGFKFDTTKVSGGTVDFTLTGLPGDPSFSGKLAADGASMAGDLSQGGGALPFRLERAPKPAPTADENAVPAKGEPGKGLAGKWRGSIKPLPGIELRLDLEAKADAEGKLTGDVISLDQGSPRLAIESLTEKDGAVRFDLPRINGSFTGKLNADGSELAGEWTQGGNTLPLVFKRRAAKS
ncbi:MAG: hypothetical protein JNK23_13325 [Opitutaceae bacterium]|nr:hypothetical protein [Opitutaceae bacterium]